MKLILIKIPFKNFFAITVVDNENFKELSKHCWFLDKNGYAETTIKGVKKKMHKLIFPNYKIIDHKNCIKLDNRKSNLRNCSSAQNSMNRPKQLNNTSGYKGVGWDKVNKKWTSKLTKNKKVYYLGSFSTKLEASKAYIKMAKKLHKQFARWEIAV